MLETLTQRDRMIRLLETHTLARASELRAVGIAATTISRAVEDGDVIRVGRGLYQLPDSDMDAALTLAEASKRVPKGTICMISALAYHGLTDQMPRKVWMAIGASGWAPSIEYPKTPKPRAEGWLINFKQNMQADPVAQLNNLFKSQFQSSNIERKQGNQLTSHLKASNCWIAWFTMPRQRRSSSNLRPQRW